MGLGYAALMYGPEEVEHATSDIAACRYDGIEVGLPKLLHLGPDRFHEILNSYELKPYCVMSGWLLSEDEVDTAIEGATVAADLDAAFLGILPPPREQVSDETFAGWLDDISIAAADAGVTPVLHHHGGALVEQPDEIERWLDDTPDNLKLLFDTAHYYPYGEHYPDGDVTDGIERFADDIAYVHLKDVAPPDDFGTHVANLSAGKVDYDSIVTFLHSFTDLGKGRLDFEAVADALDGIDYDGHVTIEIENERADRLLHAKQNHDHWATVTNRQS